MGGHILRYAMISIRYHIIQPSSGKNLNRTMLKGGKVMISHDFFF